MVPPQGWPLGATSDKLCLAIAGVCRPCNDTEILMAICTSDFGECSPLGCWGGVLAPWRREGNSNWGDNGPQAALVSPSQAGLAGAAAISVTEATVGWGWGQKWG